MESVRPFFHGIASAIQLLGLLAVCLGILRIVQAPALAARRALAATPETQSAEREPATGDTGSAAGTRERYARAMTDFYRISGAIAVLAGIVLLLVPVFAG